MKTNLLFTFFLFFTLNVNYGQTPSACTECRTRPVCTLEKGAFRFEYLGASYLAGGNTQLKFRVTNQSRFPMEFFLAELPGRNQPAMAPVASFISKYHYAVQNTFSDSLIKFTGLNTATYRYDESDLFRYEVNTAVFQNGQNDQIRLAAKAGDSTVVVVLDLNNCSGKKGNPLPAELTSFRGEISRAGVTLTWKPEAGSIAKNYAVQHALEDGNFETISEGPWSDTKADQEERQFGHRTPAVGKNHYRLQQLFPDGSARFSQVLTIEKPEKLSNFQVFPNPVSDGRITLKPDHVLRSENLVQVTLSDLNGRNIFTETHKGAPEMKISLKNLNLKPGIYLVELQTDDSRLQQRILVE